MVLLKEGHVYPAPPFQPQRQNTTMKRKKSTKQITQNQPGPTDRKRVAEEANGGQGTHVPP